VEERVSHAAEFGLLSVNGKGVSISSSISFQPIWIRRRDMFGSNLGFLISPHLEIQVRCFKLAAPKLHQPALPLLHYITQAGDYALRLHRDQVHFGASFINLTVGLDSNMIPSYKDAYGNLPNDLHGFNKRQGLTKLGERGR